MAFVASFSGPAAGIGEVSENVGVLSNFAIPEHAFGADDALRPSSGT